MYHVPYLNEYSVVYLTVDYLPCFFFSWLQSRVLSKWANTKIRYACVFCIFTFSIKSHKSGVDLVVADLYVGENPGDLMMNPFILSSWQYCFFSADLGSDWLQVLMSRWTCCCHSLFIWFYDVLHQERTAAEIPFGVFFMHGRRFNGFHTRFRDIARGGMRIVTPPTPEQVI